MTRKITVPEKFYLGMIWNDNMVPLGFLTPDGTDSAAQKRKDTVDNWVKRAHYKKDIKIQPCSITNKPLVGFRLQKTQRRYSTSNVVWRVLDPRGFEIEISSENLMDILDHCSIHNSEILDEMVYCREGSNNVLLPTSMGLYKEAVSFTKKMKTGGIKIKDVSPGSKVTLHNGIKAEYMGFMYPVFMSSDRSPLGTDENLYSVSVDNKKKYLFYVPRAGGQEPSYSNSDRIIMVSTPKVLSIDENGSKSLDETQSQVNSLLQNSARVETGASSYMGSNVACFTQDKNVGFTYREVPISYDEYIERYIDTKVYKPRIPMFFVRVNGERRIITPMRHRTDRDSVDNYSILTDIFNREDMFKMVYYQYPRYRPHMPFAKRESFSITDMVAEGESYLIRVTLDDSGRIFSRLLFR